MNTHCDGRPVIIEQKRPDGSWGCCIFESNDRSQPKVMPCAHDAQRMVIGLVTSMFELCSEGTIAYESLPDLSDFRFTHVDEVPLDEPIEDVSAASGYVEQIMRGKL